MARIPPLLFFSTVQILMYCSPLKVSRTLVERHHLRHLMLQKRLSLFFLLVRFLAFCVAFGRYYWQFGRRFLPFLLRSEFRVLGIQLIQPVLELSSFFSPLLLWLICTSIAADYFIVLSLFLLIRVKKVF